MLFFKNLLVLGGYYSLADRIDKRKIIQLKHHLIIVTNIKLSLFTNIMEPQIEDSTWDEEGLLKLDDFENYRNLVSRSTRRLLDDFYHKNFSGNEKVLEIGSGTGYLKRNWPGEFNGEWIQQDSQPTFLKESKKRNPKENYLCGNAYELPFADKTFDIVCGLGSYDVFMDLDTAIEEAYRVLKDGGLFFHILDLYPSSAPIMNDLNMKKISYRAIMSEYYSGDVQTLSISILSEANLEKFNHAIATQDKNNNLDEIIKDHNEIWEKYSKEIQPHDYFEKKLLETLSSRFNQQTIKSGNLSATYKGKKTEYQMRQHPYASRFANIHGTYHINTDLSDIFYIFINKISPDLARHIEPVCIETSSFKYVKARK